MNRDPIAYLIFNDPAMPGDFGSERRVFPFGEAPQGVELPYAVWTFVSGSPYNFLESAPDTESRVIQFDVYANASGIANSAGTSLQRFFEANASRIELMKTAVVSFRPSERDETTKHFRYSFDVLLTVNRNVFEIAELRFAVDKGVNLEWPAAT